MYIIYIVLAGYPNILVYKYQILLASSKDPTWDPDCLAVSNLATYLSLNILTQRLLGVLSWCPA